MICHEFSEGHHPAANSLRDESGDDRPDWRRLHQQQQCHSDPFRISRRRCETLKEHSHRAERKFEVGHGRLLPVEFSSSGGLRHRRLRLFQTGLSHQQGVLLPVLRVEQFE